MVYDTTRAPLLAAQAQCKKRETCPDLGLRRLFFEPNPGTLDSWRDKHGFYLKGIDRRIMFVCESPSDRRKEGIDPKHFEVEGLPGWICWDFTAQDMRFREARKRYGFENCWITNTVKCGPRGNLRPGGPTDREAENCSTFLQQEIEFVRPCALACMGDRAFRILLKYTLPFLTHTPAVVPLTHYSARGSLAALEERWVEEFGRLRQTLLSRGISEAEPVWL